MLLTTFFVMLLIFLLTKDDDVKTIMLVSAAFFFSDFLFWLSDSQYFYFRHIFRDCILAIICFWFNRNDFRWAGMVCILYVCVMVYEALNPYKTFITPHVQLIQYSLMQLYLVALTYKCEWRKWCPEKQRFL